MPQNGVTPPGPVRPELNSVEAVAEKSSPVFIHHSGELCIYVETHKIEL